MDNVSLKILETVAETGEISLEKALSLSKRKNKDHRDQYCLAFLLEEGYIGMTVIHMPPQGAETMREFSLATELHMFTLPPDSHGITHYQGIKIPIAVTTGTERVFLRGKGWLYLAEYQQKRIDWALIFIMGLIAGAVGSLAAPMVKSLLGRLL